jgi:hypothetical protein
MIHLEEKLTLALYRMNCPDSTELGEYYLRVVPDERAGFIAQHLAECPHCAREVAQLKGYLDELAATLEPGPLAQFKARVRVLVAHLAGDGLGSGLSPAYSGLRGEQEEPYVYQADEVQIVVQVSEDADHPGRKTILGLVTGLDAPSRLQVHLWQAERQLSTTPVDELGNFVIPALGPDSYELILSGPQVEIHIQDLQVGMNRGASPPG